MASKTFEAGDIMEAGEILRSVNDQPLSYEENIVLELTRRKIAAGFFDNSGRFSQAASANERAPGAAQNLASGTSTATASGAIVAPPLSLTRVQPGDLITAGFANSIIDACRALDARLRVLEAGSGQSASGSTGTGGTTTGGATGGTTPPAPSRFNIISASASAASGQKSVTVTVAGTGLAPSGLRSIRIGQLSVDMDRVEATKTGLRFLVRPAELQRVGTGTNATITITNDAGEADSATLATGRAGNPLLGNLR